MKEKGFTHIEILVVLLIMALFSAISIPAFSNFLKNTNLDTSTRTVASVLKAARSFAISEKTEYYVAFNQGSDPNEYFLCDKNGAMEEKYKLAKGIYFFKGDSDKSYPSADAVEFTRSVTAGGTDYNNAACFKHNGQLKEANSRSVYLSDGKVDQNATKCNRITVQYATGNLDIAKNVDIQ